MTTSDLPPVDSLWLHRDSGERRFVMRAVPHPMDNDFDQLTVSIAERIDKEQA